MAQGRVQVAGAPIPAGVNTGDAPVWTGTGWAAGQSEMSVRGFLAWNGSPAAVGGVGTVCVNQSLYVMKLFTPYAISVTNSTVVVSTIATAPTAGQSLVTLYDGAGVKKGDTADQATPWTSGVGVKQAAFVGGPYAIPAGAFYVSILSNAGTTPASFRVFAAPQTAYNAGPAGTLSATNLYWSVNGAAVTATASLTLSSNASANSIPFWVGVS